MPAEQGTIAITAQNICRHMKNQPLRVTILLSLFCYSCTAQNLTGKWYGEFVLDGYEHVPSAIGMIDLTIKQTSTDSIKGITLSSNTTFKGTAIVRGKFDALEKKLILEETQFLKFWSSGGPGCLMLMAFTYTIESKKEKLTGRFLANYANAAGGKECGRGTVIFTRRYRESKH
jgi:hypothetical protein